MVAGKNHLMIALAEGLFVFFGILENEVLFHIKSNQYLYVVCNVFVP